MQWWALANTVYTCGLYIRLEMSWLEGPWWIVRGHPKHKTRNRWAPAQSVTSPWIICMASVQNLTSNLQRFGPPPSVHKMPGNYTQCLEGNHWLHLT